VLPLRAIQLHALLAGMIGVFAGAAAAQAQVKLTAHYSATLAGLPIGKGQWLVDIAEHEFTATASGATAGLLWVFARGEGRSVARGAMIAGTPVPASFAATITAGKQTEELHMTLEAGVVKEFSVVPATPPNPERVPLAEAHRHGVSDPMTASLIRVAGNGVLLGPQACQRTIAVFDGRMRYDLQLAFKRVDEIKADKGYAGSAVVCAIHFKPLAGHIPSRTAIKYLVNLRDMEIWLAPLAGTRLLAPFRVAIPTPLGLGIMQATEFVTAVRPAATTAKMQ